jgi:hypothetical protein
MTGISQVGAMSSPKFEQLVKPFVGEGPSRDFRCMIYAISLARTQQNSIRNHQFTVAELQTIGSLAGERCLHFLEKKLTPQSLASLSKNELQALFLMVVGTILAIGYAQPVAESIPFPSNQVGSFLNGIQILAHILGRMIPPTQTPHRLSTMPCSNIFVALWHITRSTSAPNLDYPSLEIWNGSS